ncbi:hypothetical protein GGF46_005508 [Coemansia sp. RSA 552]|nr:hypothetical protein GGF46_005508 [Coemansia sp. RSA 552]
MAMLRVPFRYVVAGAAVASILLLSLGITMVGHRLPFGIPLVEQQFRDNSLLHSTYTARRPSELATGHPVRALFYMPVGCTFDEQACRYFTGCSYALKVCDQSAHLDNCGISLPATYNYTTLGHKNRALIEHLCQNRDQFPYDFFVKVDDDLIFDPHRVQRVLEKIKVDKRSLLGYFSNSASGTAWPTGPIYIYTADALDALCQNQSALKLLGGTHEDVGFARAMNLTGGVTWYNLDSVLEDAYHLQYHSPRVFVQYLQYGKCS